MNNKKVVLKVNDKEHELSGSWWTWMDGVIAIDVDELDYYIKLEDFDYEDQYDCFEIIEDYMGELFDDVNHEISRRMLKRKKEGEKM